MTTTIRSMQPGELHYRCRDIGYGIEEDFTYGWFTGEVDTWGKRTFQESGELASGGMLYLFPDEIEDFIIEGETE